MSNKKTVIEHFDITNKSHLYAVQYFNRNGSFPAGFLTDELEFDPKHMDVINQQLLEACIDKNGEAKTIKPPVEEDEDAPEETEPEDAPEVTDEATDGEEDDEEA